MEENPDKKYYPTYFLLVTGFSFLLFALFSTLVDGDQFRFFWWTGGISFVSGLLTGTCTLLMNRFRSQKATL